MGQMMISLNTNYLDKYQFLLKFMTCIHIVSVFNFKLRIIVSFKLFVNFMYKNIRKM